MRSSAAFYIFEAKLKQEKVDCKIFYNEKVLYATLFTMKKCCPLHFLQRKNVVRYIFYNEKMLNVTLFTAKKCDGVEYSGISDNFFDMKNVLNEFF